MILYAKLLLMAMPMLEHCTWSNENERVPKLLSRKNNVRSNDCHKMHVL